MKRSHQAAGLLAALGLALATAVQAHPGQQGGMGMHGQAGMQQGMHGKAGMQQGMHGAGQQLMTPEERSALMEKMRNAGTPEERQKIAEANRTEMQKRAKEKGLALPEHRGPRARSGSDTHTH
jgi:Spy/CpxP family protein refolding chaperone